VTNKKISSQLLSSSFQPFSKGMTLQNLPTGQQLAHFWRPLLRLSVPSTMLSAASVRFRIKCMKFIRKRESNSWQECKRRRIPIARLLRKNRLSFNKELFTTKSVMMSTFKSIHQRSSTISTRFAMKWQRIAQRINGPTLLYFGRTKERRNSSKTL